MAQGPEITGHRFFGRMPWGGQKRAPVHRVDIGVQLRSQRLVLRALERADVARVVALANNWDVVKQTASVPYPYRRWHARGWIRGVQQRWREGTEFAFAITLADPVEVIGVVSIAVSEEEKYCPPPNAWEIGYWLGEDYWRKGYAGEAVGAVIEFAVRRLKANRLEAQVFVDNRASSRLLERRGFVQQGVVSRNLPDRGGDRLIHRYALELPEPISLQ